MHVYAGRLVRVTEISSGALRRTDKKGQENIESMECPYGMHVILSGRAHRICVRLSEISYVIELKSQLVATVYDCLKRNPYNEDLPRKRLHRNPKTITQTVYWPGDVCALHV